MKKTNNNAAVIASLLTVGILVILQLIISFIVLPQVEGTFSLEIASKTGSGTMFELDAETVNAINLIALAVSVVLSIFVISFTRLNKIRRAFVTAGSLTVLSTLYFLIIIGNVFWNLWNAWAAIAGYALGFIIGAILVSIVWKNIPANQ